MIKRGLIGVSSVTEGTYLVIHLAVVKVRTHLNAVEFRIINYNNRVLAVHPLILKLLYFTLS